MTLRRIVMKRETSTTTVSFVSMDAARDEMAKSVDPRGDPYRVLRAKTRALAELLNCSEAEAEAILLNRITT
jgi:hypothetical protein